MVLRWFLVSKTIASNGFSMVFVTEPLLSNGFWVQKPLISMVLQWFLVSKTIGSNGFPMDFGPKTIASNGFSMVFGYQDHW